MFGKMGGRIGEGRGGAGGRGNYYYKVNTFRDCSIETCQFARCLHYIG